MTIYQLLCLFGIPSLIAGMFAWIATQAKHIKALKLGIQAILRDRLLWVFNTCNNRGYASINDRDNFQNLYRQYHSLGANGVMDDIRNRFFALPIKEEEE